MKQWYVQFSFALVTGLCLAYLTSSVICGLRATANSELLGLLSLTGVGAGLGVASALLLVLTFCLDAVWLVGVTLWIIKKKLHVESKDNTLYVP